MSAADSPYFTWWAQGARCGYLDGKKRVGVYIDSEEFFLAGAAADENAPRGSNEHLAWEGGYQYGYLAGASGEALEAEIEKAELPDRSKFPNQGYPPQYKPGSW